MKLPRRRFLHLATGAAALPVVSRVARAQVYPSRPVRVVVGFASGVQDITARLVGQWLSERLGQPFVIENLPGAFGNVGVEAVVRAPADGYTLLVNGTSVAFNTALYEKLNFDFIRDIAPVATIFRVTFVVVVNPSVPATTVPEFIAYAKANPGKIKMASTGNAGGPHLLGEMFKMMTGISMEHVPYPGGSVPALTDLISGQVQILFDPLPSSMGHIKAGRVRALAVTTAMRWAALPDVPAVAEFVPGYEAIGWSGVFAPRDTPREIVDKLNKEINAGLADPGFTAKLADLGAVPFVSTPAEFSKLVADETEKWSKVVKFIGIKVQ